MKALGDMRVHVAPVGFEVDRIVVPAKRLKADKVWLLVHSNPSADKAGAFTAEIKRGLGRSRIECETRSVDRGDLFDIMREVREIIREERGRGNTVYVNVASGSKIQAIGCMMACMTMREGGKSKRIVPFYPEAKEYAGYEDGAEEEEQEEGGGLRQQSAGIRDIRRLPMYGVQVPGSRLVEALGLIMGSGGAMTKKQLAAAAEERGIIKVNASRDEHRSMVRYTTLDKTVIQPLKDVWDLVEVEKIGRNHHVRITEDGENVVKFLGARGQGGAE